MDDSMLEREIEDLLAVDPAPEFRAHLRRRIAQEPPLLAGWPASRALWALGAGALAAAAAAVIVVRLDSPSPQAPMLEARSLGQSVYATTAPSVAARSVVRATVPPVSRRSSVVPAMTMIIHAPEAAAWRQLLADVGSGEVDLPRLTRSVEESTAPPAVEFMLAPIVIEPLTPESQGVHP